MEEYIDVIIKVGGILVKGVLVFFVLWFVIKDVFNISKKDRD